MALNYLNLNDGNKIPQIGLGVFIDDDTIHSQHTITSLSLSDINQIALTLTHTGSYQVVTCTVHTLVVFTKQVFKAEANGEAYNAVKLALQDGYRLLDTAAIYGNEEDVGQVCRRACVYSCVRGCRRVCVYSCTCVRVVYTRVRVLLCVIVCVRACVSCLYVCLHHAV